MSRQIEAFCDYSTSYTESRSRFLDAANARNARLTTVPHPLKGPEGESLFMDFACLGPKDAASAIVVVSGTHGIEGFCGAGVQFNLLNDDRLLERLKDFHVILLHGHNPHGFAWLRRTNEDNIDLNRNYVDFSEPQEMNEAYQNVRELILPEQFDDNAEAKLAAWIEENGLSEYQKVVMGGQRIDPQGIFYGGTQSVWSNQQVHQLLPLMTRHQQSVGLIDLHTGLGPHGHGDLIHAYPKGSTEYDNLRAWYGKDMIAINAGEYGDVVSAVPRGPIVSSLDMVLPDQESYGFVIEFGTVEFDRVIRALRADNWLHVHGDLSSSEGVEMKQEMRRCFYSDTQDWWQKIWDRSAWSIEKMADGLAANVS
ncbi:MAG: M14 family metallopeptidase [Lysobacterales bacterium]